jgi:ribonucleoside-diphosphate reductase alpha chain
MIQKNIKSGHYDKSILDNYTKEEIEYFGTKIRYSKDEKYTYAGLKQLYEKYLTKRHGKVIETPQEANMLVNMYAFMDYSKKYNTKIRSKWVTEGYRILSDNEVSLPSPVMLGLRSKWRRFISCNLVNTGDSTKAITKALEAVGVLTASRSGLGFNFGNIRGILADVDNGRVKHTGAIPMIKGFESATGMFSQEMRGGGGTGFYPFFHYEIENLLMLKNNKGTDETRARKLDHCIQYNKLFYDRVLNNENITLFHMNEVPGLYEAMGDNDLFKELYEKYEKSVKRKHKKVVPAKDIMDIYFDQREQTGRIYECNLDHMNTHSSFNKSITQSNLCCEISQIATPLDGSQGEPEIGVCILMSINTGSTQEKRIPIVTEYAVRFLDNLIDYQDYALPEVEYAATKRRPLGIGISDQFHYLAKNKVFYNTKEGRDLTHTLMESISYHLHKASILLAKDFGECELYADTKYSQGILPIDTYNKNVDEVTSQELLLDWEELRQELKEYGIRNSSLMAIAPTANSSRVGNNTPGVEPPRKLLNTKEDNKFIIKQLVPEYSRLKNYYTTAWGADFNNIDYIKYISIFQKFVDQSISTNLYRDFNRYTDATVPKSVLFDEWFTVYKYGLKTLYYTNFMTVQGQEDEEDEGCEGGGCKI